MRLVVRLAVRLAVELEAELELGPELQDEQEAELDPEPAQEVPGAAETADHYFPHPSFVNHHHFHDLACHPSGHSTVVYEGKVQRVISLRRLLPHQLQSHPL